MDGQTAVVTGASRGIGRAVATALADAGAHVYVCARDRETLETVAEDIEASGNAATVVRADVRDEFDVERMIEQAAGDGNIDAVVANAGVYHGDPGETRLAAESYATFDDHMRTNARGVFATVREALVHLDDDGRIVVSSGAIARTPKPGFGSYAVSKAAAEAVARGFAVETDHVVGIVDPGQVGTGLAGGRGHDPADVAAQYRWALTEAPEELVDGEVIDRRTWRRES